MASTRKAVIGVVGAGIMGRGIVQLFAQSGHSVYLYDAAADAVESALSNVSAMINKLVDKGLLEANTAELAIASLHPCADVQELADCDIVIEAIVENIEIKRRVFNELESVVRDDAILASNTSSLLIADIAAACERPERVAGLHFFNPVPLMKVVEIISSVRTADTTVATLKAVVDGVGHRAVIAQDQPGFLVNHAGRGLYTEGLRLLEENVTDQNGVDTVLREVAGFRMGPFELLDLTGLDVSGKVMDSIYEQFQQEPLFRPSPLVPPRIAAGLFGRKTGAGWYQYEDGKKVTSAVAAVPQKPSDLKVWIDPNAPQIKALTALFCSAGATLSNPADDNAVVIIQPWGIDASEMCAQQGLDAARCVAIDPLSNLEKHATIMTTPITTLACRDAVHAVLAESGCGVTAIQDSPGFIVQRVLATIVNIAAGIAQRQISSVADIEDAVKLGLGYPQGPLSWGDAIGAGTIVTILDGMHLVTRDPRYRPNLWLRRRAQLGVSLLTV